MSATIIINHELSIPEDEIHLRFSTSGGPGGQHANRSASRVTLAFDIAGSPALSDAQRTRLLSKLHSRLDSAGVLQLTARDTRSQRRNRETVLARFRALLQAALSEPRPRRRTKPPPSANRRRLESKRRHGELKRDRAKWRGDVH